MIYIEKGIEKLMLVLDAVYRGWELRWSDVWLDTSLTSVRDIPRGLLGSTDSSMDAYFGSDADTGTAKTNTTVIISESSPAPAATHCRSQIVGDKYCDLPMIQQLARIFSDRNFLDSVDPTLSANPTLGLSEWSFRNNRVWSSTEYSNSSAWYVNSGGYCSHGSDGKMSKYGVIPILELA